MTWQPIETAPRDGSQILLSCGPLVEVGCWAPDVLGDEYPWVFASDRSCYEQFEGDTWTPINGYPEDTVTHWMPLPEPAVIVS